MRVIQHFDELETRRACVAIGFFDGVHLGHQQIIRQTVADARKHEATAVVVSFDRHPASVVAPERCPALIYNLAQRQNAIAALGTDQLLLLSFDKALREVTGEDFVRRLSQGAGRLLSVCVGSNFTFGHKKTGDVNLLHRLGKELQFVVHPLSAVALDGETVSSTRIREAIRTGQLDAAGQMLGRTYSLAGAVIPGARLGRQLGFPTANLDISGRVLPPHGVYAAHAQVDGRWFRAAVNIGCRPTVDGSASRVSVEAHLIDFDGDLYGREIELHFAGRIRDEQRFPSLEALKTQIAMDIDTARQIFS